MDDEIKIRLAEDSDVKFLIKNVHISKEMLQRKVKFQEIVVAENSKNLIGFLQFEYLWSLVPYIAMIKVLSEHRRKGVGKKLLEFTEVFLKKNGHQIIYSSSQADEPFPQEWHRHIGFKECGIISGINEGIGEIFFRKTLIGIKKQ